MTTRQQVLSGLVVYIPLLVVPVVALLVTRNWQRAFMISSLTWISFFFVAIVVGLLVGCRRAKAGRTD
jgi:hypothetical protein